MADTHTDTDKPEYEIVLNKQIGVATIDTRCKCLKRPTDTIPHLLGFKRPVGSEARIHPPVIICTACGEYRPLGVDPQEKTESQRMLDVVKEEAPMILPCEKDPEQFHTSFLSPCSYCGRSFGVVSPE